MAVMEVSAIQFTWKFRHMKEDIREHGMFAVSGHGRTAGAFISPIAMDERELLRCRRRELARIEDADGAFVGGLDRSVVIHGDSE